MDSEICLVMKEYLEELYEGKLNMMFGKEEIIEEENNGEYILCTEFDHVIEHLKNNN